MGGIKRSPVPSRAVTALGNMLDPCQAPFSQAKVMKWQIKPRKNSFVFTNPLIWLSPLSQHWLGIHPS